MNLWEHLTGVREYAAHCPRCGVSVKPLKTRKKIAVLKAGAPVPGEFCPACRAFAEEMAQEIKRGGVAWTCGDCFAEGAEKADSAFAKAVRANYPAGAVVQVGRTAGCPICSHLARSQN